ncbi:MAG: hypothetical protein QOI63_1888 [Thermoplasmata archaeon]|nr:hypothetical protein [Thermoplasmata archaeon]
MRTTWLGSLLLIPLLAPACAAPTVGQMTATGVSGQAARLEGPLVALWQEQAASDAAASPAFTLRAGRLRVETDRADLAVPNAVTPLQVNPATDPPARHANAVVQGTALAAGYRWTLLATDPADPPRVTATGACAQGHAATHDTLVRQPRVNLQRGATSRDLSHALSWSCLEGAQVEATGNFTLSLWAWNATVDSGAGRAELRTGDGPAADPGGRIRSQAEAYLVAQDATLTLALEGTGYLLYTGAGTQLAAGSLGLQHANGRLESAGVATDVRGGAVALEGPARLLLAGAGTGQPFAARLEGEASRLAVDGRLLTLATTTTTTAPAALLPLASVLGLLGLALVAAEARRARLGRVAAWGAGARLLTPPATWRERRGMGFWALARQAALDSRVRRAQRHVQRALRWFPASLDANLLDAALLIKRGEHGVALHVLDHLHARLPTGPERFEVATMASSSAMLAGRPVDALAWLRRAAAADPLAFTREVKRPLYDALVEDAWFCAARSSFARAYLASYAGLDPAFS